ncbi:MAG: hypothetical protein WCJ40_14750 [Planctomycetota bacterium]
MALKKHAHLLGVLVLLILVQARDVPAEFGCWKAVSERDLRWRLDAYRVSKLRFSPEQDRSMR